MIVDVEKVALTDERILAELLVKAEPKLRRRFLEIVRWLRDRKSTAEIQDLIQAGRALEALDRADLARAGNAIAEAVHGVYLAAAREVATYLAGKLDTFIPLDTTNPRALRHLQTTALRMVRDLSLEQTEVVRQVIADGVARGMNPRAFAREIRQSIGLTQTQLGHVQNYRSELEAGSSKARDRQLRDRRYDAKVRRVAGGGPPLTRAEIDRMVDRYRTRYIAYRAEVIARTEGIGALHAGQEEGWQGAIELGELDAARLEQTWVATPGPRTRDSHRAMHGQRRKMGEPFLSGDGYLLRYPHDSSAPLSETAQCRCSRVIRMRAAVVAEPLAQAA